MKKLLVIVAACALITSVFADEDMQYKTSKLPDGSMVSEYKNSNGTQVRQVQRPDGTIETTAVDEKGNQTITVQHPDGSMEMKTKDASQ